jgi:ubiquinone/menaquinone biosynthesis C-methylase UbiE
MAAAPAVSPNAAQAEYWNSAATRVWAEQHELIDRKFAALTQVVLDLASPQPGERVIDIGCGSGTTVLALAARVGANGFVLGADISKQSVQRARERLAHANVRQADIALADVSTYTFEPNSFDLAFSRFGVMFFADPTATFANLRQALRPGGRLALAAFRSPQENVWATAPLAAIRHLVPPAAPTGPEEPGQFSWADAARVHRILEGAGFREVDMTPHDPLFELAGPGGAAEAADFAMLLGPVRRATLNASAEEKKAVRSGLQAFFQSQDGERGIVLPGAIWVVRAHA